MRNLRKALIVSTAITTASLTPHVAGAQENNPTNILQEVAQNHSSEVLGIIGNGVSLSQSGAKVTYNDISFDLPIAVDKNVEDFVESSLPGVNIDNWVNNVDIAPVPYMVKYSNTTSLNPGQTHVVNPGTNGISFSVNGNKENLVDPVHAVVNKGVEKPAPAPAPAPNNAPAGVWDQIAACESGGNWSINTGNGYYGGLQFAASTWSGFGGGKYAPTANQATKQQQIEIAQKVQASQGWGAWPACTARLGLR